MRTAGKTSVWLSAESAQLLNAWEESNPGQKLNLSDLLAAAVRRHTGQLNADERTAELATRGASGVEALQKELRALARRVAKLEKGGKP